MSDVKPLSALFPSHKEDEVNSII